MYMCLHLDRKYNIKNISEKYQLVSFILFIYKLCNLALMNDLVIFIIPISVNLALKLHVETVFPTQHNFSFLSIL